MYVTKNENDKNLKEKKRFYSCVLPEFLAARSTAWVVVCTRISTSSSARILYSARLDAHHFDVD